MPSQRRDARGRGYGASSQRTTLGYWVPLAITVTVATAGLAAWIWKERKDSEDHHDRPSRPPPNYGGTAPPGSNQAPYPQGPPYPQGGPSYTQGGSQPPPGQFPPGPYDAPRQQEDVGVISRVQDALRRTPSPQQFFDQASRRVTAGVAAAGAVVGNALSSIREERGDYEDHSRWSEEADSKIKEEKSGKVVSVSGAPLSDKRKTVVIVVSAEAKTVDTDETGYSQAHASILSHLPEHIIEDARVFVLIYEPESKVSRSGDQSSRPPQSLASSYSNIGHEELHSPGEEKPLTAVAPQPLQHSSLFDVLYTQAKTITEKDTMIMPFGTPSGYVQILRQLAPQIVYVQANLSGEHGESVKSISSWVGQVVLVVGDESGHGGLVDSEDERMAHGDEAETKWWTHDPKIGLGQIEVVEGLRFGEDWRRRVRGHD